jgi:CRP-like cAMP-binding protein
VPDISEVKAVVKSSKTVHDMPDVAFDDIPGMGVHTKTVQHAKTVPDIPDWGEDEPGQKYRQKNPDEESSDSDVFTDAFSDVGSDASTDGLVGLDSHVRKTSSGVDPAWQVTKLTSILKSRPPKPVSGKRLNRRASTTKDEMGHLVSFMWGIEFFKQAGRRVCEYACSIMDLVLHDQDQIFYKEGASVERLYILLDGEVEQFAGPVSDKSEVQCIRKFKLGEMLWDGGLGRAPNTSGSVVPPMLRTITRCKLAFIPYDKLSGFCESKLTRAMDFKDAVDVITHQEPARRTACDVRTIVKCLKWHGVFATVPDDALESVARHFVMKCFEPGQVICLEGKRPECMCIVAGGYVTSWRRVTSESAHGSRRLQHFKSKLDFQQSKKAHDAIRTSEHQGSDHHNPDESFPSAPSCSGVEEDATYACMDITQPDTVIRLMEWPLARGLNCSCSFVTHGHVKMLYLPRIAYLQYIRPYRLEAVQSDAALFVIRKVPIPCRTVDDEMWLRDTPIAHTLAFCALPSKLRGHILSRCRSRHLPKGEWLFKENEQMDICYLVLQGCLGCYLPQNLPQKHRCSDGRSSQLGQLFFQQGESTRRASNAQLSQTGLRAQQHRNSQMFTDDSPEARGRRESKRLPLQGDENSSDLNPIRSPARSPERCRSPSPGESRQSVGRRSALDFAGLGNRKPSMLFNPAIGRQLQLLGPGVLLGEWAVVPGPEGFEKWAFGACTEEDSDLLAVSTATFTATCENFFQQIVRRVTTSTPLQVLEKVATIVKAVPTEKRTIEQMEVLSTFLHKYVEFEDTASHSLMELTQWCYYRHLDQGEVIKKSGDSFGFLGIVLSGELSISVRHEDEDVQTDVRVLTVPQWGTVGDLCEITHHDSDHESSLHKCVEL